MKNRTEYLAFIASHLKAPRVAEVGVYRGQFSNQIVQALNPSQFIMVDPWLKFPEEVYGDYPKLDQAGWDAIHDTVKARFEGRKSVRIIRLMSLPAASMIPDASLDFVYIDGNHSYESVRDDLTAWLPKVAAGGFIGGHDCEQKQVRQAVDEVLGSGVQITTGSGIQNYLIRV